MAGQGPLLSDMVTLTSMGREIRYSLFANKWRASDKASLEPALKNGFRTNIVFEDPEWLQAFRTKSEYKAQDMDCSAVYLKPDSGFEIYVNPRKRMKIYQTIDYAYEILLLLAHGFLDCKEDQRVYADSPLYWFQHGYAEERASRVAYTVLMPQEEYEQHMAKYITGTRVDMHGMAEALGWPYEKLYSWGRCLRLLQ